MRLLHESQHMNDLNMREQAKREAFVNAILQALNGIRFGSVEITIHNSHVVQIERKEKLRLTGNGTENPR
jgi:hypothetical protein